MHRRVSLLCVLVLIGLFFMKVVVGQQQLGNPHCELASNGSCAFLDCLGSFPGGCTPDPVLQKDEVCKSDVPSGCTILTSTDQTFHNPSCTSMTTAALAYTCDGGKRNKL